MCEQNSQKSLDSSNGEPLSKRKCIRFQRYCWNCFVPTKNPKTCSILTCEQSFHVRCLYKKDKKFKNVVAWKCPDCQKNEAFGESSSHPENINEKLRAVDKYLRDNSTLDVFDSGQSSIKEKLNAGKYESGLEFLIDIKKVIIIFFIENITDGYSRHSAKFLVKECEKALTPLEKRYSSNAFAIFDDFASEMKHFHLQLETKLKVATNSVKLSLQNDMKRMRTELDIELLKASEKKGILESKLKLVNTNYEKLQNDNMQLQTEKEAASVDSNMLMTENVKLHSEKNLLKEEINRMRTDFEKELQKASEEKVEFETKLKEQLENEKHLMAGYDLELIKASDEKGQLESKLLLIETNFEKLENEKKILIEKLKMVSTERNTLTIVKEQLLKQSQIENCRMRNEFQDKLHVITEKVSQFKLSLKTEFENMKRDLAGAKNDLMVAQSELERLRVKKTIPDIADIEIQFKQEKVAMELQINELKDRLNAAQIELKQISSENDNLLIERIQLQNEKSSMQNEKDRMQTKFDAECCEASNEKCHLESKLSMVETDFEKLQDEKKLSDDAIYKLEEDLKKIASERDGLLTDKVQLHNENRSLKIEKKRMLIDCTRLKEEKCKAEENLERLRNEKIELVNNLNMVAKDGCNSATGKHETEKRMRTEFQEKLHAIVQDVNHFKLSLRPAFEMMKNSFDDLNNDLLVVTNNFQKLQNETMVLDETNKQLHLQLQKAEDDSLKLNEDYIKLQADRNTENSMSKIQIEAMKRQTSDFDAQNFRLNLVNKQLEQKIDELKKTIEQNRIDGSRIKALEGECNNLKKDRDGYRARWKYVKSKQQLQNTSSVQDSE